MNDLPIGVLLMAYGGPNSLEDIPGYLADIRRGRPTPQRIVSEIRHHYEAIGGRSPLLARSQEQMEAVAAALDPRHFRCYLGMRHWSPWIEDIVRQMVADGIKRAIALPLVPHYSRWSVEKYHAKVTDGLAMARGDINFTFIDSYYDAPQLIDAFASRVKMGLEQWPEVQRERVHVVFSAHSLPVQILAAGDPYDQQLRETARLVAERVGLTAEQWSWSYQSAGRKSELWLGPQLDEHIIQLASRGIQDIVSVPVGFVCDHVEILYDIDIQAQAVARQHGVRLVRPPALNSDPQFIAALVTLILRYAALSTEDLAMSSFPLPSIRPSRN